MHRIGVLIITAVVFLVIFPVPSATAGPSVDTPVRPAEPTQAAPAQAVIERAWAEDTAAAFRQAVKAMPRGVSNREAKARLEYLTAVAPGSVQAYEQFLRRQPDHLFAGEAKKTLLGLRLATQPIGLLISVTRLSRDDLNLDSVRDELAQGVRAALSRMGRDAALVKAASLTPPPPQANGAAGEHPGGQLTIEYDEAPGEEFFEGPMSVFGMAEPVGRGTTITARLRLTVPDAPGPLVDERLTAGTTLITSGDLRQGAVANFFRALSDTMRSRLPLATLRTADGVIRGPAKAVAVYEGFLYIASGAAGLRIVDIREPSTPRLVATAPTAADALDVAVAEGVAYVVVGHQGLQLIDVKVPAHPYSLGRVLTPAKALAVAVAGRYAYVACGDRGLAVVGVSNPGHPSVTATIDTPEWAFASAILGDLAYVADRRTLEILDPGHRRSVSQVLSREATETVAVSPSGRVVYTGNREGGIQVINVGSSLQPQITAVFAPPYLEVTAIGTGDVVIVSDSRFGLRLLDFRGPAETAIRLVPLKTSRAVAHTHNVVAVAKGVDGVELFYLSPHLVRAMLRANQPR